MNWYYSLNGAQQGPVDEAELRKLIAQGVVTPGTLVWHDGMPTWQPLSIAAPELCPSPGSSSSAGFGIPLSSSSDTSWPEDLKGPGVPFSALKQRAKSGPKGNYWTFAGYVVLYGIISSIGSMFPLANLVIGGPLAYGFLNLSLRGADHRKLSLGDGFAGFQQFGRAWLWCFLVGLFIFLWSLLFLIPGIVKTFSYAMTPYILLDHPEMGVTEAITESRRMMDGHKWELFCLNLSFIGWWLLSIPTLGLLGLWIAPYQNFTNAAFYRSLVNRRE